MSCLSLACFIRARAWRELSFYRRREPARLRRCPPSTYHSSRHPALSALPRPFGLATPQPGALGMAQPLNLHSRRAAPAKRASRPSRHPPYPLPTTIPPKEPLSPLPTALARRRSVHGPGAALSRVGFSMWPVPVHRARLSGRRAPVGALPSSAPASASYTPFHQAGSLSPSLSISCAEDLFGCGQPPRLPSRHLGRTGFLAEEMTRIRL